MSCLFRFGRQCLLTALPQVGVPNVQGLIPGQMYTPDQQCQHIYGPRSRYCYVSVAEVVGISTVKKEKKKKGPVANSKIR